MSRSAALRGGAARGGGVMGAGWNWLLVVAGALLILVEVAFGGFAGFDLVLIGSAFVLGGGIGTGIAAGTKGKELVIPAGTDLALTLDQALIIADRSGDLS